MYIENDTVKNVFFFWFGLVSLEMEDSRDRKLVPKSNGKDFCVLKFWVISYFIFFFKRIRESENQKDIYRLHFLFTSRE